MKTKFYWNFEVIFMKKILIVKNGNTPMGIFETERVEEHWSWGKHWFDFQLKDGSRSVDYQMPLCHYYILKKK